MEISIQNYLRIPSGVQKCMEARIHGVLGTALWGNQGRVQAQICAPMPCFSCAVHARFMRELPPEFVHMLLRTFMTDDRKSPSGKPSSNRNVQVHHCSELNSKYEYKITLWIPSEGEVHH